MSLLLEQAAFLKDARKLLTFADEQGFVVTGGELERTPETQALYLRDGREKTMDSPHLRKCAIALNFFRATDDHHELVQSADKLEALGQFWESLDPRNRWGGRRDVRAGLSRFERDPGGWPSSAVASLLTPVEPAAPVEAVAMADASRPAAVTLQKLPSAGLTTTLRRGSLERDAIARMQALLVKTGKLETANGKFDEQTERAVIAFQRDSGLVADGVAGDKTWTMLLSQTGEAQQAMAQRFIGEADFEAAAKDLKVELATLKSVYKVESNGRGFVGDQPKILFEGHVFWQRLKRLGLRPESLAAGNEDILYPSWTKQFYVGGSGEWQRLTRAEAIHREAARESASWGLFQIMGYHWKPLGYDSIDDFVEHMCRHERDQLDAFCRFASTTRDRSGHSLAELLAARDWAGFAYAYNGKGYRLNAYDDKLREQYRRYAA
jgi:peptidoglycan hydrolase-like protein with peptidoglycan-binding domain